MRKIAAFLVIIMVIFGTAGCRDNEMPLASSKSVEMSKPTEDSGNGDGKKWSEQEISSMFEEGKEDTWSMIECAMIPDYAYERIGVALFQDMDNEFAKVAFLDGDGHIQWCGIDAEIYSEPEFVYLGNGTVTFKLKSEDGSPYEVQITFSADGGNVSFTVKDELANQ